jgi:hypothetical protein
MLSTILIDNSGKVGANNAAKNVAGIVSAAGIVWNCVDIPGGARRRHIDRVYAALAPQISAHLKTRVAAVHPAGQGHALQDSHHAHSRTSSTLSIR